MAFPTSLVQVLSALGVSADAMLEKFAEFRTGSASVDEALDKLKAWYSLEVGDQARNGATWEAAFADVVAALKAGEGPYNPHHGGIA